MNLNHSPLANSAGNGPGVFAQAVTTCGETIPDLTGDTMMQGLAIMYNVQFRIDFAKDAKMKNSLDGQIMTTGSLIPLPALIFHKT